MKNHNRHSNRIRTLLSAFVVALLMFILISPVEVHAATTVVLEPGQTYDLSEKSDYKKYGAFYVDITKSGEYTLTGASQGPTKNTMVRIDPPKGETALVYLNGVYLAPDDTAPGTLSHRAPIEIGDSGGKVILFTLQNEFGNTLVGQGHMPAIRKDNTTTKLVFDSREQSPGTLVAKADPDGFRTCAIGCYSPNFAQASAYSIGMKTTGNIEFNGGIIEAHGSRSVTKGIIHDDYDGGAAIGSNGYGSVDGITVNGGQIKAYPGDPSAAGIGTSGCVYVNALNEIQKGIGSTAKNITINDGKIDIIYDRDVITNMTSSVSKTSYWGGAAIGGGWRSDVDGITVNGGEINIAQEGAGNPWTGIGGGAESNGKNIAINGGTIRIKSRFTGIGGGIATDETNFDIYLDPDDEPLLNEWFGSCETLITGGKITIQVEGESDDEYGQCLGIGGWNKEAKNDYVEITGGELDVDVKHCGTAIGTCDKGHLRRVTIRGGHIKVNNHAAEAGEHAYNAAIGSQIKCTSPWATYVDCYINYMEFTGGTIKAVEPSQFVGAYKEAGKNHPAPSDFIISGGNLVMNLADDMKPVSSLRGEEAAPVHLQTIELAGGGSDGLEAVEADIIRGDIPLNHANGNTYQYGLKDVTTRFSTPHLYFWVPDDAECGMVETNDTIFNNLDAKTFYGAFKNAGGAGTNADVAFYPPIRLKLVAEADGSETDGSATVLYGRKELEEFDPPNVNWLIDSYHESRNGTGIAVLSGDGSLKKESGSEFVNSDGRWIYADEDFMPDLFTTGRYLFAKQSEHFLGLTFDKNIPARTESELSGSMPEEKIYDADQNITLPTDEGFFLKGYKFTGWNTKADGSGADYTSGQSCAVSDFRKSSSEPANVILYAQWEPIRYKIIYRPNQPGSTALRDIEAEYTYDESAKFGDGDTLQNWGSWVELLTGWTYGDDHYAKNDAFFNFVDFDTDGTPQPRTLVAEWMQKGDVYVHVTTDEKGVADLADSIVLTEENGSKYESYFEADPGVSGGYRIKSDKNLPNGTYTVSIGDRRLDKDAASFDHVQNDASYVELSSYTTTLAKGPMINRVTLSPMDGTDSEGRPYAFTPAGFKLTISAGFGEGYTMKEWNFEGTEPEWDPEKQEQEITVRGTSILTPEAGGVQYTVIFDPNGGKGEMAPQVFHVGEAQKLTKSAYSRDGYDHGLSDTGEYWNKAKDGYNRGFEDEAEITADYPISVTDGDKVTLYAMWKAKSYKITYHDPSHTFNDVESDNMHYDISDKLPAVTSTVKLPGWHERNGYDFLGWKISHNGDGEIHKAGESIVNYCDINDDGSLTGYTMEAVWASKGNIVLTLTKDGAAVSGKAADIKLKGADGTVHGNCFTEDPTIAGRYVYKASGTDDLTVGSYVVSIDGFVLPEEKATIDYDPDEPSELQYDFYTIKVLSDDHVHATVNGSVDTVVVLKDTSVAIDATADEGCSFDGWSWNGDEGKPDWQEGKDETVASQTIAVNKTLELTAHAAGIVYTVTFDANDSQYPGTATGTMEDQEMVYGEPQKLFKNGFARTGYSFLSWNTEADGSGTRYGNRQSVKDLTTDADVPVTLYAQWEPLTYEITYVDPYRLCKTHHQTVKYNETVSLLNADAPGWQPEGHTLSGWQGVAMGSFYEPGQQVTNFCTVEDDGSLTGNTLYAVWSDRGNIRVTITLDDVGVDVDPDDIELVNENDGTGYSGCFLKESDTPGRYMFDPSELGGQTIPESGYIVHLKNNDRYGLADSRIEIDYSAETSSSAFMRSYTIEIEAGEHVDSVEAEDVGSGRSGGSVVVETGAKVKISALVSEEGYHFDSYEVSGTLPDMDVNEPDQTITVYGRAKLTAQAAPNVYYAHYDANGGKGETDDRPMTYDRENTLAGKVFERSHYDLIGWNTKADGSGTSFGLEETIDINLASGQGDVVTLYAQWQKKAEYSITFDLAGGELDGEKGKIVLECYEGDEIAILKAPSRKGYKFDYWKGSKYYPGDKYTVEGDHSFTAVWIKDSKGDSGNDKDKNGRDKVATGDDANLMLYMSMLLAGGAALIFMMYRVFARRGKQ